MISNNKTAYLLAIEEALANRNTASDSEHTINDQNWNSFLKQETS